MRFIGQRHSMSPLDIMKLNSMYQCDDVEAPPGATGLGRVLKLLVVCRKMNKIEM